MARLIDSKKYRTISKDNTADENSRRSSSFAYLGSKLKGKRSYAPNAALHGNTKTPTPMSPQPRVLRKPTSKPDNYDKSNKGGVGYGGNAFAGLIKGNPVVDESLLSQRLRSLGVQNSGQVEPEEVRKEIFEKFFEQAVTHNQTITHGKFDLQAQ
ncbi:hypothetical protein F4678DRAFT_313691 [Xylaria arbuscula]|nr:hypothetical protein F4678DRAFT_313691 [Xylaria arbuscula]